MTATFNQAYIKLHTEVFEQSKDGRWTALWNSDGAYSRMKRKMRKARNISHCRDCRRATMRENGFLGCAVIGQYVPPDCFCCKLYIPKKENQK